MPTPSAGKKPAGKTNGDRLRPLMELMDRPLPYDANAEVGVLGSVILLPEVLDDVMIVVGSDDFHDDAHAAIFSAMAGLYGAGKKIDPTLLVNALRENGDLEVAGGMAYLGKIINAVPNAAHATYYAEIVRDKAIYRSMIWKTTELLRDAYEESVPPRDLVGQAEAAFAQVAEQKIVTGDGCDFSTALLDTLAAIDNYAQGIGLGIKSGVHDFDEAVGGLKQGSLTVVAGRPSMGKTALALGMAMHVAKNNQDAVLFVSQEMSRQELCERALAAEVHVPGNKLAKGQLTPQERLEVTAAVEHLSHVKLFIEDTPGRTVTQVAAQARRLRRKHGLCLIVIDYLQLLEPDNPKDPRQEQVAKMIRKTKLLAKELQLPIICLAQLNRQPESTKDFRPRLAHLRESGAIEQDADNVLFVHRPKFYSFEVPTDGSAEEALLLLAKARNGPTCEIPMHWFGRWMKWENPAHQHHQQEYSTPYTDGGQF
jgi:replicative DNA helicase